MSRSPALLILVAAPALSCGEAATGPEASLCDTRHSVEVCADRAEYEFTDPVTVTTRNVSSLPIFRDGCAIKLVGVTSLVREFEERYNPTLHCGRGATPAVAKANMVRIEPGASFQESLTFSPLSFQGYYRVNVWLLDEEGGLAVETPATSGIFRVFPASSE